MPIDTMSPCRQRRRRSCQA